MKKSIQNGLSELGYIGFFAIVILFLNKNYGFEDTVITAVILILAKIYRNEHTI